METETGNQGHLALVASSFLRPIVYRARYSWAPRPYGGIFTELGNQRPLVLDACSLLEISRFKMLGYGILPFLYMSHTSKIFATMHTNVRVTCAHACSRCTNSLIINVEACLPVTNIPAVASHWHRIFARTQCNGIDSG